MFQPTPASRALYSYPVPAAGTHGTVTPVSIGATSRTHLPGPAGGLVYVRWDDGNFCGVSRLDPERVARRWCVAGPRRPRSGPGSRR